MKLAFVTGGSGFLGRTLLDELRTRGIGVRALARSAAADAEVRKHGAEPVRGDLDDEAASAPGWPLATCFEPNGFARAGLRYSF